MKTKKLTFENDAVLIADSHHGQYIPQIIVAGEINNPAWDWSAVDQDDINAVISGPENEWYWEAWCNIESNVRITDKNGLEYFLYQNDDVWAVPVGVDIPE